MSAVESRPLRRLLVGVLSALTVLIGAGAGAGAAAQTTDGTVTAAVARHPGPAGPDGIDPQHNETLVRDAS